MNMPRMHKREFTSKTAEIEFNSKLHEKVLENSDLDLSEIITIFGQCIVNLNKKDEEKLIINETHKNIEIILDEISKEHSLTYGEKVKILASVIQGDSKYVIRWERHNDLDKPGGLE